MRDAVRRRVRRRPRDAEKRAIVQSPFADLDQVDARRPRLRQSGRVTAARPAIAGYETEMVNRARWRTVGDARAARATQGRGGSAASWPRATRTEETGELGQPGERGEAADPRNRAAHEDVARDSFSNNGRRSMKKLRSQNAVFQGATISTKPASRK